MKNKLPPSETPEPSIFRVGGVRFFNARPLLYQLDSCPEIHLEEAPPAHLADDLNQGKFHAALVPSIDYQTTPNQWTIVPGVAIGSTGPVLTVQIFSRLPFDQIDTLACDLDSHTSIILAQIIFQHNFNKKLINIVPLTDRPESHPGVLLIGDKVLGHLDRWPHQLDLGEQWHQLTGLPFVYAFWALPDPTDCDGLISILSQAARKGLAHLDDIVDHAKDYGFSPGLARQYLTENLVFNFGPDQRRGLMRFYELAYELNLIPHKRSLNLYVEQKQIPVTVES